METGKERQRGMPLPESEEERLGVLLRAEGAGRGTSSGTSGGTWFAEASADVGELTVAMEEHSMEASERDVAIEEEAAYNEDNEEDEWTIREEGWASRPIPRFQNYGDVSGFYRRQLGERMAAVLPPPPVSPMMTATRRNSNGGEVGHCCVAG